MDTNRGLAGSIWAPQNHSHTSYFHSNGGTTQPISNHAHASPYRNISRAAKNDYDWDCPSCGFENFGWRRECFKCQRLKDATVSGQGCGSRSGSPVKLLTGYEDENLGRGGSVRGNGGGGEVGVRSEGIQKAAAARAGAGAAVSAELKVEKWDGQDGQDTVPAPRGALAMSRWAPRNRAASQKYGDKPWSKAILSPNPSASTTANTLQPDLSLPYEVQHYILILLQNLLEESCFAIASRWLPAQLAVKGWSCPQAVELSAWRDFLPSNLPHNALTRVEGEGVTLEQGLRDAVRIRNMGVHRHLVGNDELRSWCWKGERLLGLLGEEGRRGRLGVLRDSLNEWDEGVRKGEWDEARRRLELVLVGVGEREVGEMDWAPNEVSMVELGVDDDRVSDDGVVYEEGVDDMMDID